jgi:hypothetical protein
MHILIKRQMLNKLWIYEALLDVESTDFLAKHVNIIKLTGVAVITNCKKIDVS